MSYKNKIISNMPRSGRRRSQGEAGAQAAETQAACQACPATAAGPASEPPPAAIVVDGDSDGNGDAETLAAVPLVDDLARQCQAAGMARQANDADAESDVARQDTT